MLLSLTLARFRKRERLFLQGVMVHAYESNVTKMMALIAGPEKTPYDGGHFLFFLRFPPDYPIHSPRVRILTTGGGTVRFNPNLYANGKVCLSLLGYVFLVL